MTTDGQVVLIQLITHVVSFSSVEGLFRKPGNKMRVEQLVQELGEVSLESIVAQQCYNPHDFASALKQYFADLPEPLMLSRHIDAYIQAAGMWTGDWVLCALSSKKLLSLAHRSFSGSSDDPMSSVAHTYASPSAQDGLATLIRASLFSCFV